MAALPAAHTRSDVKATFSVEDLQEFRTVEGKTYAIVGHSPVNRLIVDTWLGAFDTEAEFRKVLEFICDLFETGDYSYWLADLRFLNSSFFHSDAWLAEYVFPRTLAAGLLREAVVMPTYRGAPAEYDVFGSASSALRRITDGKVQGFTDIEEAREWLFEET